jgi:dimethylhistidine N-methyltransferase
VSLDIARSDLAEVVHGDRAGAARGEPRLDARLRMEIRSGLQGTPKTLPPKLFYDARGARLFERICALPEYYLTRAELEILRDRAPEIADSVGRGSVLIEYGAGAGIKVRYLLDQLDAPAAYVPIDISGEQLELVAAEIAADYPGLTVAPVWADYTAPLTLPTLPTASRRRVAYFPGSTIGNFHPREAIAFLRGIADTVGAGGGLLLGVDLRKDPALLHAAYNDAQGVTAAFNLNLLTRLNRELGATFDPSRFRHYAFYNPVAGRIEMHLVSLVEQTVCVAGEPVQLARGETIWTESSYKYDGPTLARMAADSGFEIRRSWTDSEGLFGVLYLEVCGR